MKEPADGNSPPQESLVSEAIRKKHERHSLIAADLEALEASLVADIEAFDLRAISLAPEAPTTAQLAEAQSALQHQFPTIVPEGAERKPSAAEPVAAVVPAAAARTTPPAAASAASSGVSLLQELRQKAQARQADDEARKRELTAIAKQIDESLRRIFSYSHELVQQLNILKPTVERHYSMLGQLEFTNLQWQEGFVDYRTRPYSAGASYESVSMTCPLVAPEKLAIERDAISAESFRRTLFDSGVVFTCDEVRNSRKQLLKATFSITAEVKVNLRWRGDFDNGLIVLETRNLERFGPREYTFVPEVIKLDMLDELGRLLLGQPNRFREYYRR